MKVDDRKADPPMHIFSIKIQKNASIDFISDSGFILGWGGIHKFSQSLFFIRKDFAKAVDH